MSENSKKDMYDVDSPASSDPLLKNMKSVMTNEGSLDLKERISSLDKRMASHANALDNLISENKILRKKNALLEHRLRDSLQSNNTLEYKMNIVEQVFSELYKRIDILEKNSNIKYKK